MDWGARARLRPRRGAVERGGRGHLVARVICCSSSPANIVHEIGRAARFGGGSLSPTPQNTLQTRSASTPHTHIPSILAPRRILFDLQVTWPSGAGNRRRAHNTTSHCCCYVHDGAVLSRAPEDTAPSKLSKCGTLQLASMASRSLHVRKQYYTSNA